MDDDCCNGPVSNGDPMLSSPHLSPNDVMGSSPASSISGAASHYSSNGDDCTNGLSPDSMDLTAAWQSADDQISSSSNNNNNIKATITNNNPQTLFKGPLQVKVRYACYYRTILKVPSCLFQNMKIGLEDTYYDLNHIHEIISYLASQYFENGRHF